jgi:hypothetical protein
MSPDKSSVESIDPVTLPGFLSMPGWVLAAVPDVEDALQEMFLLLLVANHQPGPRTRHND